MTKETAAPINPSPCAVIYCRVSSAAQLHKGHGIGSQETRCREFARMKDYAVACVFKDEAVSGSLIDRPGMQEMLAYLRRHRREASYVVIIDDISRLARDIKAHLELRAAIAGAGARLESPSIEFGEDSDSILVENLLASVSQHQRQKNTEQTKNRMRARVMNGYWPFKACLGYKHVHKSGEGKILVRDEPVASIIQEALEGLASGRFQSQAEVRRFLESQPAFPKCHSGKLTDQDVHRILTRQLYTGYVEAPDWKVPLRKGRHEPLISLETFERVQARLKEGAYAPSRLDINADFPLRGAVACAHCGKPFTACWSTSKTGKKHPYYMCFAKDCARYRKSIPRARVEHAFAALLVDMTASPRLLSVAFAMFKDAWQQRSAQAKSIAASCEREIAQIEKQIATLLTRVVEASSESVIAAYERRIESLERSKLLLQEKQHNDASPHGNFRDLFELGMRFLANPAKLWASGRFELRRLVVKLAFADHLAYCPERGFSNPATTLPFKLLSDLRGRKSSMAGHARR